VRTGDDVVAQERLLREHFGIETLQLAVGGSMGAQQTYEWAVRFPDKVLRAAPIAGTAHNTPHEHAARLPLH
jgi:homoserine O-acetyltransferase